MTPTLFFGPRMWLASALFMLSALVQAMPAGATPIDRADDPALDVWMPPRVNDDDVEEPPFSRELLSSIHSQAILTLAVRLANGRRFDALVAFQLPFDRLAAMSTPIGSDGPPRFREPSASFEASALQARTPLSDGPVGRESRHDSVPTAEAPAATVPSAVGDHHPGRSSAVGSVRLGADLAGDIRPRAANPAASRPAIADASELSHGRGIGAGAGADDSGSALDRAASFGPRMANGGAIAMAGGPSSGPSIAGPAGGGVPLGAPSMPPSEDEPMLTAAFTPAFARACVRAAFRAAGILSDDRYDSLATRARGSAALPELRLRIARATDESGRLTYLDEETPRYATTGSATYWLEGRLSFRLDRILFADEELPIERLRLERAEVRSRVAAKVVKALSDWVRARAMGTSVGLSPDERLVAHVAELEAVATLDVLTDGWFSSHASMARNG